MSNMSYCKFENTANDLEDCLDSLNDNLDELSKTELNARDRIIEMCAEIIDTAKETK